MPVRKDRVAVFIDHKNIGIGKNMGVLGAVIVTAGVVSSC